MTTSAPLTPRWMGWLFLTIGLLLILIATNVIPSADEEFSAPRWVLFVCGVVFAAPAGAVLLPAWPRARRFFVSLVPLGLGVVGAWAAIFSGDDGFSGGVLFLSKETNIQIARYAFGAGSLICFLLAIWILRGGGKIIGDE